MEPREFRTVVARFDPSSFHKDYAFPEVVLWLKADSEAIAGDDVKPHFLSRGTIFFGFSGLSGGVPTAGQFGYFSCCASQADGPTSAAWQMWETHSSLSEVVVIPTSVKSFLAFYDWLKVGGASAKADIYSGKGTVYVLFLGFVIGPFTWRGMELVPPSSGIVTYWPKDQVTVWSCGGRGPIFTDITHAPPGKSFPVDAASMVKRVYSLAGVQLPVSKRDLKEVAVTLLNLQSADFIPAAVAEMGRMLDRASSFLDHDKELFSRLVENKHLAEELDRRWQESNRARQAEVDRLESRRNSVRQEAAGLDVKVTELRKQTGEIETSLSKLKDQEEALRLKAQAAFSEELSLLAGNPARVAVLTSLLGQNQPTASSPRSSAVFRLKEYAGSSDNWTSLPRELIKLGLSIPSAKELELVGLAAFRCGQPIWVKSIFAELIAEVLLSCRGHKRIVVAEVPAGLLEPLAILIEHASERAFIFSHANRSDLSLVLAGVRDFMLRQAILPPTDPLDAVVTLEQGTYFSVKQSLPFGPIFEDTSLEFSKPRTLPGDADQDALPQVALSCMEDHDFVKELQPSLATLSPLRLSSFRLTCRWAYSALHALSSDHARRLFFKYWLLPRMEPQEAFDVLREHRDEWKEDLTLRPADEERGASDADP